MAGAHWSRSLVFLACVSCGRALHVELQRCINDDKNSHVQSVIITSALAVTQPSSAHRQPCPAQHEDNSTSHLMYFSASPLLNYSTASASKAKTSREGVWSARGEGGKENTSGINSKCFLFLSDASFVGFGAYFFSE